MKLSCDHGGGVPVEEQPGGSQLAQDHRHVFSHHQATTQIYSRKIKKKKNGSQLSIASSQEMIELAEMICMPRKNKHLALYRFKNANKNSSACCELLFGRDPQVHEAAASS